MGRRNTALITTPAEEEPQSTDIVRREPSEEERVFIEFCDYVDAHLKWRGQPPIASTDQERREKAMQYMLRSIEAYRFFAELVGGLDMLEKLLGGSKKRQEIAEAQTTTERMVRKPRFIVKVDREDTGDDD